MLIFWPVENCTTWNLRYLMLRDAGWALRHWRSCFNVPSGASNFYFLTSTTCSRKLYHMKFAIFDVARCRMSATSLTFWLVTIWAARRWACSVFCTQFIAIFIYTAWNSLNAYHTCRWMVHHTVYSSFPLVLYHTRSLSISPLKFRIFVGKLLKVVDKLIYYNAKSKAES